MDWQWHSTYLIRIFGNSGQIKFAKAAHNFLFSHCGLTRTRTKVHFKCSRWLTVKASYTWCDARYVVVVSLFFFLNDTEVRNRSYSRWMICHFILPTPTLTGCLNTPWCSLPAQPVLNYNQFRMLKPGLGYAFWFCLLISDSVVWAYCAFIHVAHLSTKVYKIWTGCQKPIGRIWVRSLKSER